MVLAILLLGKFVRILFKCKYKQHKLDQSKSEAREGERIEKLKSTSIQFTLHIPQKSIIGSTFSFSLESNKIDQTVSVVVFYMFPLYAEIVLHTKYTSLKPKLKETEQICIVTDEECVGRHGYYAAFHCILQITFEK